MMVAMNYAFHLFDVTSMELMQLKSHFFVTTIVQLVQSFILKSYDVFQLVFLEWKQMYLHS